MRNGKLVSILAIALLAVMVIYSPFKSEEGDFSKVLRVWGNQQATQSEEITEDLLKDVEGNIVGEHKVDGSNWSIPNIIRHLLGVE